MPGADMIRNGRAAQAIMLSDKAAISAQAKVYETRIANDEALQSFQFGTVDWMATGLRDNLSRALNAVPGRVFAFNLETRP
jgi:hypothetical protein